jgi:N-formylglutamate deformylase
MSKYTPRWLTVIRGTEPLIVSLPHTGTTIHKEIAERLVSWWLPRKDTDWYVQRLYAVAVPLGATVIRTTLSRTVIDVNRDPSGTSLYPGQSTTELCPTTTFDGEPFYKRGCELIAGEIASRTVTWFDRYHAALAQEVNRLRSTHARVVVYDCHSIRSVIPRLFDGELPIFNIGTNSGQSCGPALAAAVEAVVASTGLSHITNGRFRGGYITRHYGRPAAGVHAIQMELAMRGYLHEPSGPVDESNWPPEYDDTFAAPMRDTLRRVLEACLAFARSGSAP